MKKISNIKKSGVSMLVLVITIVVILIIACVVILNLNEENTIEYSNELVFKNQVKSLKYDLNLYIKNQEINNIGYFNHSTLSADNNSVTIAGVEDTTKTIKSILPNISDDYIELFVIEDGVLYYIGEDENEKVWSEELDIYLK